MANNHSTLTELFTDIADAIREKSPPSDIVVFEGESHDSDTGKKYFFSEDEITVCSGLVAGETYTVKFGKDTYPDCTAEEDSDGNIVLNTSEHEILYMPGAIEHKLILIYYDWSKYGNFEKVPLTIYKPGTPSAIVADKFPEAIAAIDTQEDLDPELANQDDLIAQIAAALEGKAGVSGGESTSGVIFAGYVTATDSSSMALPESMATAKHFALMLSVDRETNTSLAMPNNTIISIIHSFDYEDEVGPWYLYTYANGDVSKIPTNAMTEGMIRPEVVTTARGTFNTATNAYYLVAW